MNQGAAYKAHSIIHAGYDIGVYNHNLGFDH